MLLEPGPDARQREQVSQVQRVQKRLPDVLIPVAGKRAQIGLEGIHLFHPCAEAVMLQVLHHFASGGVDPLAVRIEQQDVAGEIAEADKVRAGLGNRVVRVLGHGQRVLVREGDRPEVERLLQ